MTRLLIIAERAGKRNIKRGCFAKNEDSLCRSSNF